MLLTHPTSPIDLNARTADTTAGARAPSPSSIITTNNGNNNAPPFFLPFLIALVVLGPLCMLWYAWRRRRSSIFGQGYRYALRDQDAFCLAVRGSLQ
jgi:hypothetical protein